MTDLEYITAMIRQLEFFARRARMRDVAHCLRMAAMAAALALAAGPAEARCFSIWRYNFPQHCGADVHTRTQPARVATPQKPYYVQIAPSALPVVEDPFDQRTVRQIEEAAEHDKAVADHKDELNALLKALKEKEQQQQPVAVRQ